MPSPALSEAIDALVSWRSLAVEQTRDAVRAIIEGDAEAVQVASFLTALHFRGVDSNILEGATNAVLEKMTPFEVPSELRPILDTCGTGGDGYKSVNISTASAIVVAACDVRVAKHGNRSASGNSGSAEVLSELGIKFDAEPNVLARCLGEVGITFLYAPTFHGALRHAAPIRKQLPFRTLFNLIGPLVNPAGPDAQIIGVSDRLKADTIARMLQSRHWAESVKELEKLSARLKEKLDSLVLTHIAGEQLPTDANTESSNRSIEKASFRRAYVVTAHSGLDEVTLSGTTHVYSTRALSLTQHSWEPTLFDLEPSDFGLPQVAESELTVTGPSDSADKIRGMLAGHRGPVRDVVLANVAAALKLVEKVDTLAEGVARGAEAIDRGDAIRRLERWAALSHS